MITATTENVKISVQSKFEPNYSYPGGGQYLFSYFITIENLNDFPLQLLKRHWYIFDSNGLHREVEGSGVIGQQPLIMPGAKYSYNSACDLGTLRGRMHGTYLMRKVDTKDLLEVKIPEFNLEVPFALN